MEAKQLSKIENINELQEKILAYCNIKPRRLSDLVYKLDRNQGYIWSLCHRLLGRKLLIKEYFPPNKVYYKTNIKLVKV